MVLLFWLWITAYAVLLGAEINAEAEQQTARDTTKGRGNHSANETPSKPTPCRRRGDRRPKSRTTAEEERNEQLVWRTGGNTGTGGRLPADASLGDLVEEHAGRSQPAGPNEIELAQTEITEKLKHAGAGVGAFGGVGVLALYGVAVLIAAAVLGLAMGAACWARCVDRRRPSAGLSQVSWRWSARSSSIKAAPPVPERAVASVKTDVAEIKESIKQ